MRKLIYIQIIVSYLCYSFVAIYYNVINKEFTGKMHWWGIAILIFATLNILLALYLLDKKTYKLSKEGILEKFLKQIVLLPVYILFLPFIIIISLFILFTSIKTSLYLVSKPLRTKGFKYKRKKKPWVVYLTKNNIIIKFSYESYQISFDSGITYINIIDTELGTMEERNILKDKVVEYIGSSSLERQKGDIIDPIHDFIKFLNKYLD